MSKSSISRILVSKLQIFSLFLLTFFALMPTINLEAAGWGRTEEKFEYEGTTWNGVYFDMNNLYLTASIPNYGGTMLQNGSVTLGGEYAAKKAFYVIKTSFNGGFKPPKTIQDFVKMIQDDNQNFQIVVIDAKTLGTKYALDLNPKNQKEKTFARILSTNDRIVQMITNDESENRRAKFFNSVRVR